MTIPTVEDLLQSTAIGWGKHQWRIDCSVITVDHNELREALEDAYDPTMPSWPAMVQLDD